MGPKLSKKRQKSFDESSSPSLEVESLEPQHVAKKAKGVTTAKSRKGKGKEKRGEDLDEDSGWPEYFHSLFRLFKAINTVLAFVSSRKQMANSFDTIRASVENIIRQPLDLSKVAELKALLPDIIKFAYVPRNSMQIFESQRRARSPDFSTISQPRDSLIGLAQNEQDSESDSDHVLTLEFIDSWRGSTGSGSSSKNETNSVRTPTATKKLVEKRNERFRKAVNELLTATPANEDPVALIQAAARDHIPINPDVTPDDLFIADDGPIEPIPDPENRPSIKEVLQEMQKQRWYRDQIVDQRTVAAKDGTAVNIPLSSSIKQALRESRGIESLYSHQASAINAISQNKNVIVSTPTASGKSVIYQIPLLKFLEENKNATAMFVYPTKALAQDQKTALENLLVACPGLEHVQVATYDGDTPHELRTGIRSTASVIFTNFDMIHVSILPHEDLWRSFLKNLKLFVVDELHYYSGNMGSHVAYVMRRFRRICAAVGNRRTRFVSCSATVSNPGKHMVNIFGIDPDQLEVVEEDGAPSGQKECLIWQSPYVDEDEKAFGRTGAIGEATGLMRFLMKRGIRVILFCKIRKVCELVMKTLRAELTSQGRHDILNRVQAYRGGYSPEDRRRIEREAFTGHLLGIVATNALELGVDIGALDAVIMLGFPMSIASFRQQSGRAGRRRQDSLAILVATGYPLDQYYVKNPDELFDGATDDLIVDLDNKYILEAHLQCAAHEMPMSQEDEKYFGPMTKEICEKMLHKDSDGWFHTHNKYMPTPSKLINIRGVKEDKYVLVDVTNSARNATILEEIETSRALFEIYEGAVFLHQGKTFIVQDIKHDSRMVELKQVDVNWTTRPRDFTDVNAVETYRIREITASPVRAYYGRVEVRTQVFGFHKIRHNVILDIVDVESDPWEQETTGMWVDVPPFVLELIRDKHIKPAAAIHSAEHAFMNQFALSQDLRTECKAEEKEYLKKESRRKRPARLIIYDPAANAAGVSAKAFDNVSGILRKALAAVGNCDCLEPQGCAKCVLSPTCKEKNAVASKAGALAVLKALLGLEVDPDSIPYETDERHLQGHDSIVSASSVRERDHVRVETT
ncbi:ATP-dependent 3'-5' DNA helicase [Stygiomarasmius scandens]|uniref:ATP-dependent 3'-5' DNA helicase n=1 Tax=Marasmiellus scandens TaxID=2682957 RepID=A0ABR1IX07_9AGAR